MTSLTFSTISEETFNKDQSLCLTWIAARSDGQRFRTRIKRNAYDTQSHAIVDVWTATGWAEAFRHNDITTLRIGKFSYVTRENWMSAASVDAVELLETASKIVP